MPEETPGGNAVETPAAPEGADARPRDEFGRFVQATQELHDTPPPGAEETPEQTPPAPGQPAQKPAAEDNSVIRQMRKQLDEIRKENETFKRRAEEERRAKMTEEQQIKEERDQLQEENARLREERLKVMIAAEFRLPAELAMRIQGTDEAGMREDAAALAKLLPKPQVGRTTNPQSDAPTARIYKRSELRKDARLAASPEVLQAMREGRISSD